MQTDSKSPTFDPFRYYPEISINDLSSGIPPEYRKQIAALLNLYGTDSLVTNLITTYRDSQGNSVYGPAVVNKPWEWMESLGEPSVLDPKEEEREREEKERLGVRHLVKNSTSISLENFGTRIAGDGVRTNMLNDDEARSEGCTRFFEDGLSENIFIRDWRESRLDFEPSLETNSRGKRVLDPETLITMDSVSPQVLRASPSSSVMSRSSTTLSGLRHHQQSPALTAHSRPSVVHEVIDVDNLPTGATSMKGKESVKRKMSSLVASDDELEIVDAPATTRSMGSAKRQKTGKVPSAEKNKVRKR